MTRESEARVRSFGVVNRSGRRASDDERSATRSNSEDTRVATRGRGGWWATQDSNL